MAPDACVQTISPPPPLHARRGGERLDHFKQLMSWNQEQLEQWAAAQRQKEEDNSALEAYHKQDAAKKKELMVAVEKLSREVCVPQRLPRAAAHLAGWESRARAAAAHVQ